MLGLFARPQPRSVFSRDPNRAARDLAGRLSLAPTEAIGRLLTLPESAGGT
jgi:hypothetical protein